MESEARRLFFCRRSPLAGDAVDSIHIVKHSKSIACKRGCAGDGIPSTIQGEQ